MDTFVLHVSDVPSTTGRAAVGAVAGLLGAVVTNVPMQRRPEGATPPFVVAAALTGREADAVDARLASGVHYAGGVVGGVLFTLFALGFERALPFTAAISGVGLRVVPLVLAVLCTFAVAVVAVGYVVLPAADELEPSRVPGVRTDWVLSSSVYALAVAVWVVLLVASL